MLQTGYFQWPSSPLLVGAIPGKEAIMLEWVKSEKLLEREEKVWDSNEMHFLPRRRPSFQRPP